MKENPTKFALCIHNDDSDDLELLKIYLDKAWFQLAEQRLSELENKEVNPISWEELKLKIRGSHKKD